MTNLKVLVKELEEKIDKQNLELTEYQNKILDKDNEIRTLSKLVSDLNNELEGLKGTAGGNKLGPTDAEYQAKLTEITEKEFEIMELNAQITAQQQKINELEAQIPACQALIQDLQQQLAAKAQMPSVSSGGSYGYQQKSEVTPGFYPKPSMLSQPTTSPTTPPAVDYGYGETIQRQCPQCGATGFAIKEFEDRTKIISYVPRVTYAKKRVCTKCSYEF